MAMEGNIALMGEPHAEPPRVAVFTRSSATAPWNRNGSLYSSKANNRSEFGRGIALDGNVALVESVQSVYVFKKDSTGWHRTQQIRPPKNDGATDYPGAIAFDHGIAVVTAKDAQGGLAYVYNLQSDGRMAFGTRLRSLTGVDDGFGASAAIENNTIAITAPDVTSAFVFKKVNSHWKRTQQLTPVDPANAQDFGASVAVDNGMIVVGAPHALCEGETGELQCGAAYVFSQSNGTYVQTDVLHPGPNEHPDYQDYGGFVRLSRDRLVVGAHEESIIPMGCCETLAFTYTRESSNVQPLGLARQMPNAWNMATDGQQLIVAGDTGREFWVGYAKVYDIRHVE
jgi:hypothetical protein